MLITNAAKLCAEGGFQGHVEWIGCGYYAFVISTAAGPFRVPITPGVGPVFEAGRVNEYVVEAILVYNRPAVTRSRSRD